MRLYLAGPMTGYPEFNFPAFEEAAVDLRRMNYVVWSPHESDLEAEWAATSPGYSRATGDPGSTTELSHRYFLAVDLAEVCKSDGVAVLPGWQASLGAKLETYVAFNLDIPVHRYESGELLSESNRVGKYEHPDINRIT